VNRLLGYRFEAVVLLAIIASLATGEAGVVYHLVASLFDPPTRAIEALTAALPRS
jgi:hypothetical protein